METKHRLYTAGEYSKLTETFTASKFSGRTLARLTKRVGAKYITLTTRHHDGVSLYDTRGLNIYDSKHSGTGRNLIADFVECCVRRIWCYSAVFLPFYFRA